MPAPIRVVFQADMSSLNAAFEQVGARARKMNEQVANDTEKANRQRVKSVETASKAELKARQNQQAAETKIALDGARSRNKIVVDAAKTQHKVELEQSKASIRLKLEETREHLRAEREKTKATQKEAQQRGSIERKATEASVTHYRSAFARTTTQSIGRAARSTMGTVTGIAGGLGATAGMALVGSALWQNVNLREQAALLVNATRDKTGAATQSVAGLTGEAQSLAGKYGVGATDVMKGMGVVSARAGGATGLAQYRADIEDITKTAVAFGVSMEDMGGVVAAALNAGVKPGQEMRDLIQDIAAMGKDGAVEIKDLAQELAKLGGAGKMTELSSGQMLRRQVGMAQIAAQAAVSPEESRTAVKDLIRDINTAAPSLQKSGIKNIYGKTGLMNDPAVLVAEIMDKAMKEGIMVKGHGMMKGAMALNRIFTGTSQAVVGSLMADYNKGGKEGVLAKINAASGATLAPGERDIGVAQMLKDPATQLRMMMETLKADIGTVLVPELVKLAPVLSRVTLSFAKLIGWAAQNPFTALTGIFGGYLAKELAAVGMSKMFETGIRNILLNYSGGAGGVGGVGGKGFWGGGGAAGALATIGTVALTATAVYLTASKLIEEANEAATREGRLVYKTREEAENALLKGGDKATKLAALTEAEKNLAALPGKKKFEELSIAERVVPGWHALQESGRKTGEAGSRSTSEIQADITQQKEAIYAEHEKAQFMAGFAILNTAGDKLSAAADKLASGLPNQSGNPTSKTPTDPKMK